MKKLSGRDYPLSPTPEPTTDTSANKPMSRKEYKNLKRQAKWEHNIEAARAGTLGSERMKKVKNIAETVGTVIGTAASAKTLLGKKDELNYR